MKHHLIAIAAAGLLAAPFVQAQGSVTIYGIVDLAARSVDNQGPGSMKSLASGSASTSRIGLRGSEDLGGGLGAGFDLEHGLAANTGHGNSGTRFWDRRSTVSLTNKTLGELRLGRDFVPSYRNWSRYDPFSYVGVARSADLFSNAPAGPINAAFGRYDNTTVRADNTVQYLLPKLSGLEGEIMVAAGQGGDASAGRAKLYGVRLGYASKIFGVSAATTTSQNSLTTAGRFRDTAVGASYRLRAMKLSAAWRQMKYGSAQQTNLLVGAEAGFGPHVVKASWNRVDMQGRVGNTEVGANDADKLGLGYMYAMSRRTAAYTTVARISNDGAAKYTIPGGPSGIVAGGSSTGYEAGLIHRF